MLPHICFPLLPLILGFAVFHVVFHLQLVVCPAGLSTKWLSMLQLGSAGLVLLDITLQSLWLCSEVICLAAKTAWHFCHV